MICTSAPFGTRDEANEIKRGLSRQRHLTVTVQQCETCDHYHLKADATRLHIPKKCMEVMRYLASGHTYQEVQNITGIPTRTVVWYVQELKASFSAMSLAHLVSIMIALGLLKPLDFVPTLTERTHATG